VAWLGTGVKLVACQLTIYLFDFKPDGFIDGMEFDGNVTLFALAGAIRC